MTYLIILPVLTGFINARLKSLLGRDNDVVTIASAHQSVNVVVATAPQWRGSIKTLSGKASILDRFRQRLGTDSVVYFVITCKIKRRQPIELATRSTVYSSTVSVRGLMLCAT